MTDEPANKQMQPTKRDGHVSWPAPRASLARPRFAADLQRSADHRVRHPAGSIPTMLLGLLLCWPPSSSASCPNWKAMGPFADIDTATVVFEGVLDRIELAEACDPERVVFRVDRVWKGEPAKEFSIFQRHAGGYWDLGEDGRRRFTVCPISSVDHRFTAVGRRFIVMAAGPVERLHALGCGTCRRPTRQERRRLDRWKAQTHATK